MLKAKTATARFKVEANKVQDFVGKIENLPKWATSFCLDLRTEGQDYIVKTPAGDMFSKFTPTMILALLTCLAAQAKT